MQINLNTWSYLEIRMQEEVKIMEEFKYLGTTLRAVLSQGMLAMI
jgi:hypothetical protein